MPTALKWTDEELQDMVTSYTQGETAQSIAKRYGTSHQVILPVLFKQGVKLRTRHENYGHRKHTFDACYFRTIDTEGKAYWLGFLTADGSVSQRPGESPRITLHLGLQDYSHLVKFRQALQASQVISRTRRSCSFTIVSSEMAVDLATHGIVPRKTFSTRPAQVSPELARHYWRGIIDGDGCITAKRKDMTLVGDYEVVLAFQTFVLAHCPKVRASIFRKENIYTLNITGDAARRMLDVLYGDATVFLERKYVRAIEH